MSHPHPYARGTATFLLPAIATFLAKPTGPPALSRVWPSDGNTVVASDGHILVQFHGPVPPAFTLPDSPQSAAAIRPDVERVLTYPRPIAMVDVAAWRLALGDTGHLPGVPCATCAGAGTLKCDECPEDDGEVVCECSKCGYEHDRPCPECEGTTRIPCPACGGGDDERKGSCAVSDQATLLGTVVVDRRLVRRILRALTPTGTLGVGSRALDDQPGFDVTVLYADNATFFLVPLRDKPRPSLMALPTSADPEATP